MPRDTGAAYGWRHDWYHPTVDAALSSPDCAPSEIRVGFWDDVGSIAELDVRLSGISIASESDRRHGALLLPLTGAADQDTLRIIARDTADNRQIYEKSVRQLISECRRDLVAGTRRAPA